MENHKKSLDWGHLAVQMWGGRGHLVLRTQGYRRSLVRVAFSDWPSKKGSGRESKGQWRRIAMAIE